MAASILAEFNQSRLGYFLESRRIIGNKAAPGQVAINGMGAVKGRWQVSSENYPEFLDLLHEHLFIHKLRPWNFVEQRNQENVTPLLVDLDFRYDKTASMVRQFDLGHVRTFIKGYVGILAEYFDLSDYEKLRFFVPLRPAPYEDKKSHMIKDGVHIQCPDICLSSKNQEILRLALLEREILEDVFAETNYVNEPREIIDEAVIKKNGWFFYGEGKPDIPPYQLAMIYVYNIDDKSFTEESVTNYSPRDLMELLSIRYELVEEHTKFIDKKEDEWNEYLERAATSVAATAAAGAAGTAGATAEQTPEQQAFNQIIQAMPQDYMTGYSDAEIATARILASECLSAQRADKYDTWISVGWCLNNIDDSDEMFNTWMVFSDKSAKSSQNNRSELQREWRRNWGRSTYDNRILTMRSLHMWAMNDNPELYKRILSEDIVKFIECSVDETNFRIARLVNRVYKANIRCCVQSRGDTPWFEYNGNSWVPDEKGTNLRLKMATEVCSYIDMAKDAARRQMTEARRNGNDELQKFHSARLDHFMKIEKLLYSAHFKSSTIKECELFFNESNFIQVLDSNPYLIGVANGVINLRAERLLCDGSKETFCEFRPMMPDDYISFMCGRNQARGLNPIPYVPYDPHDPIQTEIDHFFETVFPDPEVRNYMWRKLSSCLEGANKEQRYDTWIGVGGNGKSKLVDLMALTLGDYATSLQSTALTRKRPESGAANPDIIAVWKKRFIYLAEPDDGEPLNTSRMKQFTGEDVVEARGLFQDQQKFQITGKLFMLCNRLPPIHTNDRGTWRRVIAVPFESKFVDSKGPEGKDIDPAKHIYGIDYQLDNKIITWRSAFLGRLVHVYETQYLKNGIMPIPEKVLSESMGYRAKFDSFGKFLAERVRKDNECEETAFKEFFNSYKSWVRSAANDMKPLSRDEFNKRLDDEFGKPRGRGGYRFVRVFNDDEEVESFDNERRSANK